jgi:hypothetical protein
MPTISMFYGIIVQMFNFDNKKHNLPHIHIKYAEHNAIFSITDGKLVDAWIEIHREDLLADWNLAINGDQPFKIEPLK